MGYKFQLQDAYQFTSFRLHNIHCELQQGDALALIGSNGSGKSTLLRSLSLFFPPQSGFISLNGDVLHNTLTDQIEGEPDGRVIYQAQDSDAWATLTVEKNISISPLVKSDLLNTLVGLFELEPLLKRRIWELSGGERQRANLVRALSVDAPVTLLDEPSSSLSYVYTEALTEFLLDRRKEGRIFVFVTHYLGFCRAVSNKYMFMDKGEIVDSGETTGLTDSPNQLVQRWIGLK